MFYSFYLQSFFFIKYLKYCDSIFIEMNMAVRYLALNLRSIHILGTEIYLYYLWGKSPQKPFRGRDPTETTDTPGSRKTILPCKRGSPLSWENVEFLFFLF